MKTSESIVKIAAALLSAQKAITFAVKDSANPHFRSTYADLSSVIEACKPALNNAGIAFMQMPAPSDPGTIALTTRLIHESGEWIESTATCPLQKVDPQGYGSANTYLRRYSLAAAVGLYQDDDDGNAASKGKGLTIAPVKEAAKMTPISKDEAATVAALVADIRACWEDQQETAVLNAWRSVTENDLKIHIWDQLKDDSKIRSFIRANQEKAA